MVLKSIVTECWNPKRLMIAFGDEGRARKWGLKFRAAPSFFEFRSSNVNTHSSVLWHWCGVVRPESLAVLRIFPKRRMVPSQVPTNSTAFRSQTWLSAEIWNLQTTIGWIVLASLVVVVVNTIAGTDNRDTTDATGCYLSVWRKMRSRVSFAASVILVPGPKIAPQLLLSFNKKS